MSKSKFKIFQGMHSSEIKFESFVFSGGEVQVKIIHEDRTVIGGNPAITILADIRDSDGVMQLLMLTDAVRRKYGNRNPLNLHLPYIPYARQDRVCQWGEALGIKVFADLINSQGYSQVTVWDPHSDVAPALINNCDIRDQSVFIIRIASATGRDYSRSNTILVSPDAGANKKVFKLAKDLIFHSVVRADKVRDVKTGAITDTVVYSTHVGDKDFLIVDDILDGGATFIALAEKLRGLTTGKIYLYVTHGIFSKGIDVLVQSRINKIFVANLWLNPPDLGPVDSVNGPFIVEL